MGKKNKKNTVPADDFVDMVHPHTITTTSICPAGIITATLTLDNPAAAEVADMVKRVGAGVVAMTGEGTRTRPRPGGRSPFGPFDARSFAGGGLPAGVLIFPGPQAGD